MRIVRLLLVLFVLSVTALSAAPPSSGSFGRQGKGGIQTRQMAQSGYYYYCYRDGVYKSCGGYEDCMNACLEDCGPPCTWEGEQQQ
jgi:hypothetical protein